MHAVTYFSRRGQGEGVGVLLACERLAPPLALAVDIVHLPAFCGYATGRHPPAFSNRHRYLRPDCDAFSRLAFIRHLSEQVFVSIRLPVSGPFRKNFPSTGH